MIIYWRIISFFFCSILTLTTTAQLDKKLALQAGPMAGYADMREAMIWVQTTCAADVFAVYTDMSNPAWFKKTQCVKTSRSEAFTARLIADSVEPGHRYSYEVFINGEKVNLPYTTEFKTPPIWKWRTDPPEFSFLTGSCAYINQPEYDRAGKSYGSDYQIFSSMAKEKADFMIWLGDNLYLREPDWNSWTGIINRNTHTRSLPELQPFLASTQHYSIWDDHDYGPNDSNRSFSNKNQTYKAFQLFWGNPTYGVGEIEGAITSFQWGDADFFLLDNRWYRDPDELDKERKTMLGVEQLDWLLQNLVTSKATFKVVALGGQFLTNVTKAESYSAFGFDLERQQIIDFIYKQNIKNVIFLTGDVHFTELSVLRSEGKPTIYDCTFSSLTAGSNTNGASWYNTHRVPGTVVTNHNFGRLHFSGPSKDRKLTVSCHGVDGSKLWEQVINQE